MTNIMEKYLFVTETDYLCLCEHDGSANLLK